MTGPGVPDAADVPNAADAADAADVPDAADAADVPDAADAADEAEAADAARPGFVERLRARWGREGRHDHRAARARAHHAPHRTAFVLAGGGSRGAVQIGMLEELIRRGIRADRVFGASVGAINGASYAGNPTLDGIEHMKDIWRDLKGTDIFPRGTFDGPWAWFQKRSAVHANTGLRRIIESGIGYENLEDAKIPVEVVTTSLTDGRERWITHGPAIEAILASSAIPSIFPPVTIDGDVLVDGGVTNNVPISRALNAGCDRIYVLLCGPLHYHPPPPKRPAEAALTAFFVAVHARFVRELAALPPGVEVIVFSGGGEPAGQYRDFSATVTLIEEGRREVGLVLDRYAGTSYDLGVEAAPPDAPAPSRGTPEPSAGPEPDPAPAPSS
jgi:NTE family protein